MPHRTAAHSAIAPRRPGLRLAGLLIAATLAALGGCASAPSPLPSPSLLRDHAYRAPAQPLPSAEALFALSPAMHAMLETESHLLAPQRDPRRSLVEALHRPRAPGTAGLRLEYESTHTRTAAEAFEAGAGNCLSLVMMTAAFAKHLGLTVSYQAVRVDAFYSRSGSLTLASGHVNLVMGPRPMRGTLDRGDPDLLVVDFLSPRDLRRQNTLPLQERTIVAMYFNNRAAELVAAGQTDAAYWHAREALRHDPGFASAANTLGVVHLRAGQPEAAEAAFRHVLSQGGDTVAALGNLVALLRASGRGADAEPLARRLAELQPEPPFHWLHRGREALRAGDAALAVELLQRELRRQPEQDEVHFALAEALLGLGDPARALHHLARAVEFATRRGDQRRYAAKLEHLRTSLRSPALPLPPVTAVQ